PLGASFASVTLSRRGRRPLRAWWGGGGVFVGFGGPPRAGGGLGGTAPRRSERRRRGEVTKQRNQSTSSRPPPPLFFSPSCGQEREIRRPRPEPKPWNNSSVTNGMKGCSRWTIWSSVHAAVARVSALAASSSPFSTGLISSRYQSQNTFQTKR